MGILCRGTLVLSLSVVASLALAQGRLISIDSARAVSEVNMLTGEKTLLGTVGSNAGTTGGLAYDRANDVIYLTSTSLDSLFTLDLNTFTATLLGPYGDSAVVMHGLEYDSSTGTLYGASSHNNGLYRLDKTNGAATLIGTSGLSSFTNLATTAPTTSCTRPIAGRIASTPWTAPTERRR